LSLRYFPAAGGAEAGGSSADGQSVCSAGAGGGPISLIARRSGKINHFAPRLGGPEHRYWKKRLAELLKAKGYEVVEEYPLGGGLAIDIVASRDGKMVAVEVETGRSDAKTNALKCLMVGMDLTIIAATSENLRERFIHQLPQDPRLRVVSAYNFTQTTADL